MQIKILKLNKTLPIPKYATNGSACMDVYSSIDTFIYPDETQVIPLGIAVEIPKWYELQVRGRSGLSKKGIIVSNGIGTIDSDYRGEIGMILTNLTSEVFKITQGDRVGQVCLSQVIPISFEEVEQLSETERGAGGYGSTGK